jgi:hypothetical protein
MSHAASCSLPAGSGVNRPVVLTVGGQSATTTYTYAVPTITKVVGCGANVWPGTQLCSPAGGTFITIDGTNVRKGCGPTHSRSDGGWVP